MGSLDQLRGSYLEEVHLLEMLPAWLKLVKVEEDHVLSSVSCCECFRIGPEEGLHEGNWRDLPGDYGRFIAVQAEHV